MIIQGVGLKFKLINYMGDFDINKKRINEVMTSAKFKVIDKGNKTLKYMVFKNSYKIAF